MTEHTFELLLKDLCDINKDQGFHNGLWTSEECRDYAAERYLNTMKRYADEYGIKYEKNLKDNFDPDYWEKEFNAYEEHDIKDELGHDLKLAVVKQILNEIFEHIKFDKENINIRRI